MHGPVCAAERSMADRWRQSAFGEGSAGRGAEPPFSFRLADQHSSQLLPDWAFSADETTHEDATVRASVYSAPAGGLEVRCETRAFRAFPAVEWVLHFTNHGGADTPIIADIQALDTALALPPAQWCAVHHSRGSRCRVDDFEPLVTALGPGPLDPQGAWRGEDCPLVFGSQGGRSSNGALPFFNVELAACRGVVGAIGWTGDWSARLWRAVDGAVRAQAGMRRTHLRLRPGESIRSPRMLLVFWEGERMRGHNLLRRLILAHYAPRRDGRTQRAPISFAVWGENRVERQLAKVRWFADNDIPVDNFWVDAGWHGDTDYKDSSNVFNSQWYRQVGNWWPNATAYPEGLGAIGEATREAGMDFTLWLEPERVFAGTRLTQEHPEWLLGPIGDNSLLNLGRDDARRAVTDLVSSVIEEAGVTVYRQDFNTDPAPFWEAADAPDRVGMSEIRHIEGLYAFWDELLARRPGLLIDNCSSGGRRIDLETLSRSIPLWRSDLQCFRDFDPIGMQGQTHGLSLWAPLHTGACDRPETYALRSALGAGIVFCPQPNEAEAPEGYLTPWEAFDPAWLREAALEQKRLQPYYVGDFYPVLSYSLAPDAWAAWQFDRPDLGEGMVLALRRPRSPFTQMSARLSALDPSARYEVTFHGSGRRQDMSGEELTTQGLTIRIEEAPGTALITYRSS